MIEFEPEVLNAALELATEWGENFRKPIGDRMKARFPELSDEEIEQIEALVRKAEFCIYEVAAKEELSEISEGEISLIAAEEFPWIEDSQIARLKNIGMYYARR
jgi:hypothetical protein